MLLEVEKAEETASCGAHMVDGLNLVLESVGEPERDWCVFCLNIGLLW